MISQKVFFKAEPIILYEALMDENKHAIFTGAKAKIDKRVGGKFLVWDGYAEGKNLALEPGELIVQTWRASDWPKEVWSEVTIKFKEVSGGTEVEFTQTGIPKDLEKEIDAGWKDYYWKPLEEYLTKGVE